uniref:Uncharacterized protein n=1 Tax=Trepomonas sp. PC1 TaxID=1076344 RepID=A0A146K944_9EUKA|eukprot:JAP93323.1 Hypothetical protein TPC1_14442 [Trepomonas sp. PC1]
MQQPKAFTQIPHTERFKPSKQLIQITKRKMDEANNIIKNLEKRLATTTSTTERTAIMKKLEDIKKQYANYIGELQSQEAAEAPALPREHVDQPVDMNEVTQQIEQQETQRIANCDYNPSKLPIQVVQGNEILKRRTQKMQTQSITAKTWSEIQKQQVIDGQREDQEAQRLREERTRKYREELGKQVEMDKEGKESKLTMLKTRPKSPKIYDSTFANIGQVDLLRQETRPQDVKKWNEIMSEQVEQDALKKKTQRIQQKQEVQIDLSKGILPTDRLDENGRIKKIAIPDQFLKGEFSNQVSEAPQRQNPLKEHFTKQQLEKEEIQKDKDIEKVEDERKQMIENAKTQKIEHFQKNSMIVLEKNNQYKKSVKEEREGSLKLKEFDEVVHGNFYQTVNRRVNKQPNAHQDVVYGEGNFISRMDKADYTRAMNKEKVEIEEDVIKQKETQRMLAKNPQKRPLDESDVNVIKNYIDNAREQHERNLKALENQRKYHQELEDFQKTQHARSADELNEREKSMMVPPKYIKAPF